MTNWTLEVETTDGTDDLIQPELWRYSREIARALKDYGVPVKVALWSDRGETIEWNADNLCQ